jgi:hypothetical protein
VFGAIETDPPETPIHPSDGDSVKVAAGTPAWETANEVVAPPAATTTYPVRAEPAFCPAVTINASSLLPEVRFTATQLGVDCTAHDIRFVVTMVLADPPKTGIELDVGETRTRGEIVAAAATAAAASRVP